MPFHLLETETTNRVTNQLIRTALEKSGRIRSSRHAAAIIMPRGNRVISIGWNKLKSHPMQARFSMDAGRPQRIFLHAETDAIIKTINKHGPEVLSECDLYVIRVGNDGTLAGSRPCTSCCNLVKHFGINHVFHS
jgi:tRNA(Arg) A34 adenosine deaminase TadA